MITIDDLVGMNDAKVWAYVFITTRQPRKVVQAIRKIPGVAKADALLGTPDAIAIVEGTDIASMDAVIDRIAELPDVMGTDSKVARWINMG
jgi:DNA-binding Lrp family transcriptional regulator